MSRPRVEQLLQRLRAALDGQEDLRGHALNLIASQNFMSPMARAALSSAFADKIAAGAIGHRGHLGAMHVDELETTVLDAAEDLYGTRHVEYRLMSGAAANQMAILAMMPAGATLLVMPKAASGDPSVRERGYPRWLGAPIVDLPFDYAAMNVDLDEFRQALRHHRPAWVIVGGSRPLFPYPIAAMRAEATAVGARILYDGAHILGLWAGGEFQDPLAEGADMVTGSTQKTLPGPVGGLLLTRDPEIAQRVGELCDDVLSNYNNARVAALAVTLCEMMAFGREYATAIVANARGLGAALADEGFAVVGADRGFTASHQVLMLTARCRVPNPGKVLESAGLLCTPVRLVTERGGAPQPGLRLGTSEVTRRGMAAPEMKVAASLMGRLLLHAEPPSAAAGDIRELATQFSTARYTFSCSGDAGTKGWIWPGSA